MLDDDGTLTKRSKIILNKKHPDNLEVVICEIRRKGNDVYFIISLGGDKEITIHGRDEWDKLLDLFVNLDWDPEDTWIRPPKKERQHTCRFCSFD